MTGSSSMNKEDAARRQIDAAIRMLFLHKEDLCAVHTVAAAALNIARDLAGKTSVGEIYETRLALTRLYMEHYGRDPIDADVADEIKKRAQAIEGAKSTTQSRNKLSNFLKHADKDPNNSIDEECFDTGGLIAIAIQFYTNMGLPFTIEMYFYVFWWLGVTAQKPADFVITRACRQLSEMTAAAR